MTRHRVELCVSVPGVRRKTMTAGRSARASNRPKEPGRFIDPQILDQLQHESDTVALREREEAFGDAEQKDATLTIKAERTARALNRHRASGRLLDQQAIEELKHDSDTVAIRERPFGHAEQKDATLREIGSMTALMDDVLASDANIEATAPAPPSVPRLYMGVWPCRIGLVFVLFMALWVSGSLVPVCDASLSFGFGCVRVALKMCELLLQMGVHKSDQLRNRFDLMCCDAAERWCNDYGVLCRQRCSYKYSYL